MIPAHLPDREASGRAGYDGRRGEIEARRAKPSLPGFGLRQLYPQGHPN